MTEFAGLLESLYKIYKFESSVFPGGVGMGNDTVINGSYIMEILLQSGHTTLDLYCPIRWSTITD